MKFSIEIPTCGEGRTIPELFATPRDLIHLTQMAERLGFDSVWGDDHITSTPGMRSAYREPLAPPNYYEVLISLACAAEATERIFLGAGVIQLILRDPVLLAKQAATLDVFSGGRVLLGLGLGSHRDEFEMLARRQSKTHRGKMLNEAMEALNLLLTEDKASFKGEYYEFQDIAINPKPVQRPFPVYISGDSPETPNRVARWGTGWLISQTPLEDIPRRSAEVSKALERVGRDLSEIDVAYNASLSIAKTHQEAVERYRNSRLADRTRGKPIENVVAASYIGSPNELIERIGRLQEAGVTRCNPKPFAVNNFQQMMEQIQMFGEEVLPAFKPG